MRSRHVYGLRARLAAIRSANDPSELSDHRAGIQRLGKRSLINRRLSRRLFKHPDQLFEHAHSLAHCR
jgi:hypothetical protein